MLDLNKACSALTIGVVLCLPLDALAPIASVLGLHLTLVELVLGAALCVCGVVVMRDRPTAREVRWTPMLAGLAAVCALMFGAALAAPPLGDTAKAAVDVRTVAMLAALRLSAVMALGVALAVSRSFATTAASPLVVAAVGSATLVAAVGWLEVVGAPELVEPWLAAFRAKASIADGGRRLTATFAHANLAAGYLAGGLGAAVALVSGGSRRRSAGAVAVVVALASGLALTGSRGGLVAAMLACVTVACVRRDGRTVAAVGLVLVAVIATIATRPSLQGRWGLHGDAPAYSARFIVPATMEMRPDERRAVSVSALNTGYLPWRATGTDRVGLLAHVFAEDPAVPPILAGDPLPLMTSVGPGNNAVVQAAITAPVQPGRYAVVWDLMHVGFADFSARGSPAGVTTLVVVGAARQPSVHGLEQDGPAVPHVRFDALAALRSARGAGAGPDASHRIGRGELWRIATAMISERPLLGWGLNTFRMRWPSRAPGFVADHRVHTNNVYLELAVGAGLLALLAGLFGLGFTARFLYRGARAGSTPATAALGAASAFAVHGLVDAPLFFYANVALPVILVSVAIGVSTSDA